MIVRRESIDVETGNRIAGEEPVATTAALPPSVLALDEARKIASVSRIQEVIAGALAGKLPRDRELHSWEADKLNARHVNVVLDKAAGYTNIEIAERNEYTAPRISMILSHPDAQYLLSVVLGAASDKVADVTTRLKHLAPEALNVKVDILRDTRQSATVRDRIASDILDRAGYGARKQIDVEQKHTFVMPAQAATGLARVLEESNRIAEVDYSQHLRRPQDDEVAQAAGLQLGTGHTEAVAEPLLGESPEVRLETRVA